MANITACKRLHLGNFTREQNHSVSQLFRGSETGPLISGSTVKCFLQLCKSAAVVLELSLFWTLLGVLTQGFSVSGRKPTEIYREEELAQCVVSG